MNPAAGSCGHVYIYYRMTGVRSRAHAAVASVFADVEAGTGTVGRLLARRDDPDLWMEVYGPIPELDPFLAVLATAVQDHAAIDHAAGGLRHCECFVPVAPAPDEAGAAPGA